MRVSSDLPTTVRPFSLNSTGIVAACAALMRSIPCLRSSRDLVGKPGTDHYFPTHSYPVLARQRKWWSVPGFHPTSWGKYFITESTGLGAACPSPHMDASIIAWESSFSSGWSHFFFSMSLSAFAVPTLQGVHCPHDSSEKNFMRLLAAVAALSLSQKIA